MGALKIAASRALNKVRHTQGEFWQLRYYDHAVRTVKEFNNSLRYMHFNPVTRGLVDNPEDWPWSSIHSFGGPGLVRLAVDLLNLPCNERARLQRNFRILKLRFFKTFEKPQDWSTSLALRGFEVAVLQNI